MPNSFKKHPCQELNAAFKGWQGQDPAESKVLFVGFDANFPEFRNDDQQQLVKQRLVNYLNDGVEWWMEQEPEEGHRIQYHHPSLLRGWGNVAHRYHRPIYEIFGQSGVPAARLAEHVSFVDLLGLPTIGNSSKDGRLYGFMLGQNKKHLASLERWFFGSKKTKTIFVPDGVAKFLISLAKTPESKYFPQLRGVELPDARNGHILILEVPGPYDVTIIVHSFPSYGALTEAEREEIAQRLAEILE